MSRKTKLDRMTAKDKRELALSFQTAPLNAEFSPEALAIVFGFSLPWLQKKRCEGGGIPFSKPSAKVVLYKKQDVLNYIDSNRMSHTG